MRNPPAGEETAGGVRRFQASPRQGNQQEEVFALGPGNPLYVFAGPMLLSRAWELPVGEGWAFEPKWDGFRCLAHLDGDTRLHSRRGTDLTPSLPELRNLHDRVPTPVVLDAELVWT